MKRKTKIWLIAGAAVVAVAVTGAFAFSDSYLGNNIDIEEVLPAAAATATSSAAPGGSPSASPEAAGESVAGEQLNGSWSIADSSKVYFSVTTSRETVNFVDEAVSGNWTVDVDDPSKMQAEGRIDMASVDSGNGQRDGHVKGEEFFNVAEFPQATFKASSIEGLPQEWTEGQTYDFKIAGTLTVRGIEKEVEFASRSAYRDGQLLLSGTTTVTFADFGMKNPHNVVLDTENDIGVRLELVLTK